MKKITKIERFRLDNALTKKKLADYLGVSDVFIGKVCSGVHKLPEKHIIHLINNENGWDTRALRDLDEEETSVSTSDIPRLFANKEGIELIEDIKSTLRSVLEMQSSIVSELKRKDEQIASLMKIIENLTKK